MCTPSGAIGTGRSRSKLSRTPCIGTSDGRASIGGGEQRRRVRRRGTGPGPTDRARARSARCGRRRVRRSAWPSCPWRSGSPQPRKPAVPVRHRRFASRWGRGYRSAAPSGHVAARASARGALAQLARALARHARGQRFESSTPHPVKSPRFCIWGFSLPQECPKRGARGTHRHRSEVRGRMPRFTGASPVGGMNINHRREEADDAGFADRHPRPRPVRTPLDCGQTAHFLRCTDRHLRDLRKDGELVPVLRSAGKVLYFPGDVLAYANLTLTQALALAGGVSSTATTPKAVPVDGRRQAQPRDRVRQRYEAARTDPFEALLAPAGARRDRTRRPP